MHVCLFDEAVRLGGEGALVAPLRPQLLPARLGDLHTHTHTHTHIDMCMHTCMRMRIHMYMYMHMYTCM